jgi:hypothetical protein
MTRRISRMNKDLEKPGEEHGGVPPKPYLTREETNRLLEKLTFQLDYDLRPVDTPLQRQMMAALEELIAGAIAEWVGIEFEEDGKEGDSASVVAELQEWAEEYLVG